MDGSPAPLGLYHSCEKRIKRSDNHVTMTTSDRKYRQRGYQDDDARPRAEARGPRNHLSRARPPERAVSRRTARRTSTCRASARSCAARSAATRSRPTSASTPAARGAVPISTRARSACRSIRAAASSAWIRHSRRASRRRTPATRARSFSPRTTVERETTTRAHRRRAKGVRRSVQVLRDPRSSGALQSPMLQRRMRGRRLTKGRLADFSRQLKTLIDSWGA